MKNNKHNQLAFSQTLYSQMSQSDALDNAIRQNLEALGYGK
ncbi:hypothetical protein [Pseudoalteromonas porphyrae]|nr:hypothetical protein [Pseudoalteromonas porphyrae]